VYRWWLCLALAWPGACLAEEPAVLPAVASQGPIDTALLEQPWPGQWVHEYEVGRDPVLWRHKLSREQGILTGARFVAPASLDTAWALSTGYTDLGAMTPGVSAVRVLEESETRQVIEVDIKVLWKRLTLRFEIERAPPRAVRFRLTNEVVGEYRGLCRLTPHEAGTAVELATWLRPAVPVPERVIVGVMRYVMLRGIREFLRTCRGQPQSG